MSDLVGNPEDRFSGVAAHIMHYRRLTTWVWCSTSMTLTMVRMMTWSPRGRAILPPRAWSPINPPCLDRLSQVNIQNRGNGKCNIHRFFSAVKIENFIRKKSLFLIVLKTLIVGTRLNCFREAVLMSTHSLLWIRNKGNCIPL